MGQFGQSQCHLCKLILSLVLSQYQSCVSGGKLAILQLVSHDPELSHVHAGCTLCVAILAASILALSWRAVSWAAGVEGEGRGE